MKSWFLAGLICLVAAPALAQSQAEPEAATGWTPKPEVAARQEMVVAANPLAARAGADVLAAGGSAVDAAIATLLVLNVVEPQSSGLGGGAFALIHGPDGPEAWDGRETAPMGATPDLFLEDGAPLPFLLAVGSGRSVGVPALIRLIEALHAEHGRLPLADLFQPAIRLARDGVEVSPRLARMLTAYGVLHLKGAARDVFLPGGVPPEAGTVLRQPELARTLEELAEQGADAFYRGRIAQAIVAAVAEEPRPGTLALADLAAYRVKRREAVCHPYRDWRLCGMGPPSSGATTVGQILMLMERALPDPPPAEDAQIWHVFAEASRLAYADRALYLADTDFVKVPVKGLLDPAYMTARAGFIDPERAAEGRAQAGAPPWREGRLLAPDTGETSPGTTHLVVIDKDGLAVSLTATIEAAFGSGRMAAGFLLNNELTDFSFIPVAENGRPIANAPAPGKRPRSSMAPTLVYDGARLVGMAGSPGGSRIPEYVAQALVLMLDHGVGPADAAAWPHLSHRNRGVLALELDFDPGIAESLAEMGHAIERREMTSGLHLIWITDEGEILGGADPRREGAAFGR